MLFFSICLFLNRSFKQFFKLHFATFYFLLSCLFVLQVYYVSIIVSYEKSSNNAEKTSKLSKENISYILLLTQMRSGSKFTGEILSTIHKSFYTEEPLVERSRLNSNFTKEPIKEFLKTIFNCEFSRRPRYYQQRMFPYFMHNVETRIIHRNFPQLRLDPSLDDALCRISTTRIIRTVQTPADEVFKLLHELENIKIIHLVRDPRGIIYSRRVIGYHYDDVCERLLKDLRWIPKISFFFRSRLEKYQYNNIFKK